MGSGVKLFGFCGIGEKGYIISLGIGNGSSRNQR